MTGSNKMIDRMLKTRRDRKRIQALFLCLAMLVSVFTVGGLKLNGVAVTLDDADPIFDEVAINDLTAPEEPAADQPAEQTPAEEAAPQNSGDETTPEESDEEAASENSEEEAGLEEETGSEDAASEMTAEQAEGAEEAGSVEAAAAGVKSNEEDDSDDESGEAGNTDDETGDALTEEEEDAQSEDEDAEDGDEDEEGDMPAKVFTGTAGNMFVRVEAPEGAFPKGTTMQLELVEDEQVLNSISDAVEAEVVWICAVDISFFDADGNEIEPMVAIHVEMVPAENEQSDAVTVVHLDNEGEATVVEQDADSADQDGTVRFAAESFSVYAVVGTTIEKNILASDGHNYKISVTYGPEAGVPENADLEVSEILQSEEASDEATEYETYLIRTREALGAETEAFAYSRFFDIRIVDENGEKVEILAPVDVKIELADKSGAAENTLVVHFSDAEGTGDVIEGLDVTGDTVSFETDGFSVYAIVEGPDPVALGWQRVRTFQDLIAQGATGLYIGHTGGYYFKDNIVTTTDKGVTRTGIGKTKPAANYPTGEAVKYYFEQVPNTENQVYAYCYVPGTDTKQYVYNGGNNSLSFTTEDSKTAFTVSVDSNGVFTFNKGDWYWNMQGGANGTRFCSYNNATDANNKLYIWYSSDTDSDPYGLDGQSYTLLTWDNGKTGKALTGVENQTHPGNLCADFLTVMTNKNDNELKLFAPNNTADEVTPWTFIWQHDDFYKMSATIYTKDAEGNQIYAGTRYLKIDGTSLSMVESVDDATAIQVVPGTGIHEGQIFLKSGNSVVTYSGVFEQGFNIGAGAGNEYLYLAAGEPEDILSDYFRTYSATKISVSDPSLSPEFDGDEPKLIIIYTRVWNGSKYQFFAIDGNGKMVPCSESGDEIEWRGSGLDELQWYFTEYGSWEGDEFTPNYYYELQNSYTKQYLAPLITADQILSGSTIGLNMNGRRNGQYYTPILAWDEGNYSFASVKADMDTSGDALIEPCYRADGMDLYFAIVRELDKDDTIHTVPTVDNNQFGITMRLADYSTVVQGVSCTTTQEQTDVLVNKTYVSQVPASGLLSTNLDNPETGYPTATLSGRSLGDLYAQAQDVNHLFIESTYKATGYYEYDSAQNFASLKGNTSGDFTVYQEIGTYDTAERWTLKHGQFLPYNDIQPGHFASKNGRNLYTPTGPLSPQDPRYNEQLYLVDDVNSYFGVELTASFYQTPSGLDDWGHDIIFEFSGDDDFWLYVDGELVIDLGGIHSALPGSVNFRTGDVYVNGAHTTLYDLFYQHYTERDGLSAEEATALLATKFETKYDNELGKYVTAFADNSRHTMRIFYMERGAGASNLHMRFNLASVQRGTVQLSKELDVNGVDMSSSTFAVFPYQIYYKNPISGEYVQLTEQTLGNRGSVKYLGSTNEVTYKQELYVDNTNPDHVECSVKYDGVYLIKPGETVVITFPIFGETGEEQFVSEYKVVECGVDPNVYTEVKLDGGTALDPEQVYTDIRVVERDDNGNPETIATIDEVYSGLCNYGIVYDSPDNRSKVSYKNNVEETEKLRIQKNLYRKNGEDDPTLLELYDAQGNPIHENDPDLLRTFDFRVYFKTPYDADYSPANVYEYHVKDPAGCYCKWVAADPTHTNPNDPESVGHFEPILHNGVGVTNYDDLTDDTIVNGRVVRGEKFYATFDTSMNGSIAQIPAYYDVELHGLIPGTQFKVVERPTETPDGYKFYRYELDGSPVDVEDAWDGVTGIIRKTSGSEVLVDNYKGFALQMNKTWADAATMKDRDATYFAVYYEILNDDDELTRELVEGSVRRLAYSANPQELKWFYLSLPGADQGRVFENFVVREVTLTGDFTVAEDGVVSGYSTVTPVEEGGIVTLEGTANSEGAVKKEIPYQVTYAEPVLIGTNFRQFKAANTPSEQPAVKFMKEDWAGNPLAGAIFTLTQGTTKIFENRASAADTGLISVEYLTEGTDYILKETTAPQGYYGLQQQLTVRLVADTSDGWTLDVTPDTGDITAYYEVGFEQITNTEGTVLEKYVTLTVRNHPYYFEVVKEDGLDHTRLSGVKFNLYQQVTTTGHTDWSNDPVKWDGSADLITDENGVIPHLDSDLPPGTYQLREVADTASLYNTIGNINFTVTQMGVISLAGTLPDGVTLSGPTEGTGDTEGKLVYTITVPNTPKPLTLKKVDASGDPLVGAKFSLRQKSDVQSGDGSTMWAEMAEPLEAYNSIDLTEASEIDLASLPVGTYRLEETEAPSGYIITQQYFYFVIKEGRTVALCDEDGTEVQGDLPTTGGQATLSLADGTYTITVQNIPGVELPVSGGIGTRLFYLIGGILLIVGGTGAAAGIPNFDRRRRKTS